MGRRMGEDTFAARRRRMPFVAKIKREDPFSPDDERDIAASGSSPQPLNGCRWLAGVKTPATAWFHFATWAKARAMQHWIDRRGFAHQPVLWPNQPPIGGCCSVRAW